MKSDIERIQGLLERSKDRFRKDFESWFKALRRNATKGVADLKSLDDQIHNDEAVNTVFPSASSTQQKERDQQILEDERRMKEVQLAMKKVTSSSRTPRLKISGLTPRGGDNSDERSSTTGAGLSARGDSKSLSMSYAESSESSSVTDKFDKKNYIAIGPNGKPIPKTGDAAVDAEIAGFYKAMGY